MENTMVKSRRKRASSMAEASTSTLRMKACMKDGGCVIRERYMGGSLTKMGWSMRANSETTSHMVRGRCGSAKKLTGYRVGHGLMGLSKMAREMIGVRLSELILTSCRYFENSLE